MLVWRVLVWRREQRLRLERAVRGGDEERTWRSFLEFFGGTDGGV